MSHDVELGPLVTLALSSESSAMHGVAGRPLGSTADVQERMTLFSQSSESRSQSRTRSTLYDSLYQNANRELEHIAQ